MRSSLAMFVVGSVSVVWFQTPPAAQAPQTPPTFRGRVDLVPLDVSVWDQDGQPVRGLTAADFTLLEDNTRRDIVTFSEVDMPEPPPPTAAWIRDAAVDVETNAVTDKRLFMILVDDASFGNLTLFPSRLESLKEVARSVIRRLGPTDLAAVIFTGDNRRSQDFTADHGRLLAAVNQMTGVMLPGFPRARGGPPRIPSSSSNFLQEKSADGAGSLADIYSVTVLERVVESLMRAPGRRKTLIDITNISMTWQGAGYLIARTEAMFEKAQRAGVNVYTMGPKPVMTPDFWEGSWFRRVAHETGGEWFGEILEPGVAEQAVTRIFQANSSYYILGYSSADLAKFHFIKVLVDRPDVTVRTREKHYRPKPEKPAEGPEPPPLVKAISEVLANADIPMRAVAMPFATPGAKGATIAVVTQLRLTPLSDHMLETFDLRTNLFTAEGDRRGSTTSSGSLRHTGTEIDRELLSTVTAPKAGLYALRIGAHRKAASLDGSVYTTVDVPDFAKLPVSFSGVVVSLADWSSVEPRAELAQLLPARPTTAREFGTHDRVRAYLRVYQGGGRLVSVAVQIGIVDDHGRVVLDRTDTLPASRCAATRSADVLVDLPIWTLAPGAYLLTFDAAVSKATARRQVRFSVKAPQ
jgi:VWFA-related protein